MASKTEICNLAISHLGIAKEIGDIITENSQEANACRRFYDVARDAIIRDYAWPFCRMFKALPLVAQNPTDEWLFAYRYPNDVLKIKRILSGIRNDTRQSRVPYVISQDSVGKLILCDIEQAQIEYITTEDDPLVYPPDFILAFSYRLASYIAPRITGGNAFGAMSENLMKMYRYHLSIAIHNCSDEEQREEEVQSEFIRVRNGE